jgi:hypothetical protein
MSRLLHGEYGLHPAVNFQAKALSHYKVGACDVPGLRFVGYRQRLFHGTS